jgi:hypothetical protein
MVRSRSASVDIIEAEIGGIGCVSIQFIWVDSRSERSEPWVFLAQPDIERLDLVNIHI